MPVKVKVKELKTHLTHLGVKTNLIYIMKGPGQKLPVEFGFSISVLSKSAEFLHVAFGLIENIALNF